MTSVATDRLSGISTSVALKAPVKAVSSANLTLSGLQTVGGVALVEGDRVLVKDQSDNTENGIYDASSSDWTRSKDFDGNRDAVKGTLVVTDGVSTALLFYRVTTANPVIIGTSALTFEAASEVQDPYPITAAEISAGITPSDFGKTVVPTIDVRRYGIIPNSTGARTANTTALQDLLDPTVTGPTGRLLFPNTTGNDTYYFNDMVQVRDNIHMDLCGCTLDFAKTYAAADDRMGFFTFIRSVTIENGKINADYDGSAGVNAGPIMRIGSRNGYKFGTYTDGIFDEDDLTDSDLPLMGNIVLRNLTLTCNNSGLMAILMFGGIDGFLMENVRIDLGGEAIYGVYYEFGFASTNGQPLDGDLWSSSHGHNMHFRNVRVENGYTGGTEGSAISLIGAYNSSIDGLFAKGLYHGFEYRPGEALFHRPWANFDDAGAKRGISLKNIVGQNIVNTGLFLKGAESASTGYLASAGLDEIDQVDLMTFSVDGFSMDAAIGINVSGPCSIANGAIVGASSSGGIIITDECVQFDINNVKVLDGAGLGIRASFGGNIFATARKKIGQIRNCLVAGNTGAGININNSESIKIENCRLGYNTLYDGVSETTQTAGVNVATDGKGVVCEGCYVSTSGGASAYTLAGTGPRGCSISNGRGTNTISGTWARDGMGFASSTNIADVTAAVNTVDKYTGKRVFDTSNNRLMIAVGASSTSNWAVADGSATVTPTT